MNELKQRIEQMEQQLAQLKAEVQGEEQEPMFPVIQSAQVYYFVNAVFGVGETFYGSSRDKLKIDANNAYPLDQKDLCEAVAKHYADTNWFVRAAKMFAEGYEFIKGYKNYEVYYDVDSECWDKCQTLCGLSPTTIYMSEEQGDKFIAWLQKYKPEGLGE